MEALPVLAFFGAMCLVAAVFSAQDEQAKWQPRIFLGEFVACAILAGVAVFDDTDSRSAMYKVGNVVVEP